MTSLPVMQTGYCDVEQGRLYYEVAGAGSPLVLLHAGLGDCRMWEEQFTFYARQHRVIRYDERGFGRSQTADGQFSDRRDLLTLLQHLNVEHMALLGLSRGSQIALDFTLEFADRVQALILCSPGLPNYSMPSPHASPAELDIFAHIQALGETGGMELLAPYEMQLYVDGPGQSAQRVPPQLRAWIQRMNDETLHQHYEIVTSPPPRPPSMTRLHEISVPTLILVGELDCAFVHDAADTLQHSITHAQTVMISSAAHLFPLEQSAYVSQVVMNFLQ